jgi:hypothetical protein
MKYIIVIAGLAFAAAAAIYCASNHTPSNAVDNLEEDWSYASRLFWEEFGEFINDLRMNLPVRAGMSIQQLDQALKSNSNSAFYFSEIDRKEGSIGWRSYWISSDRPFFMDITIERNTVKSIWVMPGNYDWNALVFVRLSGSGGHYRTPISKAPRKSIY